MLNRHSMMSCVLFTAICTTACVANDTFQRGTVFYSNDFESNVGEEWSKADTSVTPNESRRFLGQFGPEKVTLSLAEMPEHQFVRISFDLFLIQSWDGSSRNWGPDVWELSVEGGPRLIHATFTNCGFFSDNNSQSFPDDHPSTTHKGWTGASEKQSLGYKWFNDRNKGKGYVTDGVYRIDVIFPHVDESVKLNFLSHCKDAKEDQSWGLDNVRIETVTSAAQLSDNDMNDCWMSLAGDDPVLAFRSIWQLVSSGEQALEFLEGKIRVDGVKASDEIRLLLDDLDDDSFQTRERATKQLSDLGRGIEPILQERLESTKSSEARFRIAAILKRLKKEVHTPASVIRRQRAMRVLEVIQSAKALELRELLQKQVSSNN